MFAFGTKHRCLCFMCTSTERCAHKFQFPPMIFTIWQVTLSNVLFFRHSFGHLLYTLEFKVISDFCELRSAIPLWCHLHSYFLSWSQRVLIFIVLYPVWVEFITLGPHKAGTPGERGVPRLLCWASQPKWERSNKRAPSVSLSAGAGVSIPRLPAPQKRDLLLKPAVWVRLVSVPGEGTLSHCLMEQWPRSSVSPVSQTHCTARTKTFWLPLERFPGMAQVKICWNVNKILLGSGWFGVFFP